MTAQMVIADTRETYGVQAATMLQFSLAYILAIGGVVVAGYLLCGWGRTQSVSVNFFRGSVNIVCR
jgi:hypothetical protein